MSVLFPPRAFTGFGPCRLHPWPEPFAIHQIEGSGTGPLRIRVRQECPRHPGVYGMVNGRGELIYVGKAKSLRARLLSYFRTKSRDPKAGHILRHARRIVWEFAPSEFAALLRELELIRRWKPHFNVHGQPLRRQRTYVCLGRRPAPYVFLSRRPPAAAVACFGPIFPGAHSREAVRRVNDWFGLRDCPQKQEMIFADQTELFPVLRAAGCIRLEIGTCLGPCAAACSRATYDERVQAARAFLDGADPTLLHALQGDMAAAATALAFERAGILRDKLTALQWLDAALGHVRRARAGHSFVYPVAGHGGHDLWYLVRHGWVAAALRAPRTAAERQAAAAQVQAVFEQAHLGHQPTLPEEMDTVLLVAAWFRKHGGERARALEPAAALATC